MSGQRYRIIHTTEYSYAGRVSYCHNQAFLTPRDTLQQRCEESRLEITPQPALQTNREDYFGNRAAYFEIQTPHRKLSVTANSVVTTGPRLPLPTSPAWETVRDGIPSDRDTLLAGEFRLVSPQIGPPGDAIKTYATESFSTGRPLLEAVDNLNQRIFDDFEYDPQFSTVVTPLSKVVEHRRGVCQDFAHLMIACLRAQGLACRYVSGYLETIPPPGVEKLVGSDASHAWAAVFCPGSGWFDFDPTNNQRPNAQYITTAWGRDYADVAPLKGVIYGGGKHQIQVFVDVIRLDETPNSSVS